MNYDQTLNLPSTDFPMRGNLPQREPEDPKILAGEPDLRPVVGEKPGEEEFYPS